MANERTAGHGRKQVVNPNAYVDTVLPAPKATSAFKPTEQAAKKRSVSPTPTPTPATPAPGRKSLARRGLGLTDGPNGTGGAVGHEGYPHGINSAIGHSTVTPTRPTQQPTIKRPANQVRRRQPSAGLNPVKPATQTQSRKKNNDPWSSEW
jgi:hypothetical protein